MSDEREMAYAHAESLEGLLQRGRGLGAVRACRDRHDAAAFVYDWIRRDWRWHVSDDRALYLARLVRDLELSVTPVVAQLTGEDESCLRAGEVLELLALAGSDEAREGLRAYVRSGDHWVRVLESLSVGWPTEWWEDPETLPVLASARKRSCRGSSSRGPGSGSKYRADRPPRGRR